MTARLTPHARPSAALEGTKMYGTFLSSHRSGRCSRISMGFVSAVKMTISAMPCITPPHNVSFIFTSQRNFPHSVQPLGGLIGSCSSLLVVCRLSAQICDTLSVDQQAILQLPETYCTRSKMLLVRLASARGKAFGLTSDAMADSDDVAIRNRRRCDVRRC